MIRIGVDVRPLAHPATGIGRYTGEVLRRLIASTGSEFVWHLYVDRPIQCGFLERAQLNETRLDQAPVTLRSSPKWNRLLGLWRTQVCFSWWSMQDKLDLFWSPRHHLPLFLSAKVKKIVTIHDLVWKLFPATMPRTKLWAEQALMPPSLCWADKIICVSRETQSEMIRYYPKYHRKSNVIYEGKNRHGETDNEWKDRRYFLFVGTLEPRKNLERVLNAYKSFLEIGLDDHKLIIAGAEGWDQSISEHIENLRLSTRVQLMGRVDDFTLHSLYQHATALLLVSLYEGFGLPAVEAMQYGVPVIGSNQSSIPEVVGEAGILVNPLNTEEIKDAMVKIVRDQGLMQKLSALARRQAEKFSWDKAASETLSVFREVVAERNY